MTFHRLTKYFYSTFSSYLIKYNEYVAKKKGLSGNQAEEVRETSVQSTSYIDGNGKRQFNKRKLIELPNFLSKLTSSISIKNFCELIFFNYDFFFGMLHVFNIQELYDCVMKANEVSSYNLNESLKVYLNDLQLLKLIFLQNGALMIDYPSSGIAQVVCKSLKFYGSSINFSRLIDEYYKKSLIDNSLIIPYGFLYVCICFV